MRLRVRGPTQRVGQKGPVFRGGLLLITGQLKSSGRVVVLSGIYCVGLRFLGMYPRAANKVREEQCGTRP